MPSPNDLTGQLYRTRGKNRAAPIVAAPRGRKMRVDWFFRGAWIVLSLLLFAQLGLIAWTL